MSKHPKKIRFIIKKQSHVNNKMSLSTEYDGYYTFTNKISAWLASGMCNGTVSETDAINLLDTNKNNGLELDGLLLISGAFADDKVIMKLLEMGANKDARSSANTRPILYLARRDKLEMFKHFIKIGAYPFSVNDRKEDIINLAGPKVREYLVNNLVLAEKDALVTSKDIDELKEKNKKLEDKLNKLKLITQ